MLKRAARLVPAGLSVRFLADRGFADTTLMHYLREDLHWHFRIRIKSSAWVYRPQHDLTQLKQYHLSAGESVLLQRVTLTRTLPLANVNVALGRDPISRQFWLMVSDEPVTLQTFREYGERFQIEEELLDEKSNGFQLERSEIRSVPALSRLCLVLAVTTLVLSVQGQEVVLSGKRQWVDVH